MTLPPICWQMFSISVEFILLFDQGKTSERWIFKEQQQANIQTQKIREKMVKAISIWTPHADLTWFSCGQIPGFPDRKRFGGGTLKSLHYDWIALIVWKSEQAVAVVHSLLLAMLMIIVAAFSQNHLKRPPFSPTFQWKAERKWPCGRSKLCPCPLCSSPFCPCF